MNRLVKYAWYAACTLSAIALCLNIEKARAADVSMKDTWQAAPVESPLPAIHNPTGFWGSLIIGYSWTDRSIHVDSQRTIGADVTPEQLQNLPQAADTNEDEVISAEEAAAYLLSEANVPSVANSDGSLSIPLIGDVLKIGGDSDADSPFLGGEISYVFKPVAAPVALEIGLDVLFYTDNESRMSYSGASGVLRSGTASADIVLPIGEGETFTCANMGTCAGEASPFPQSGSVSFKREMDIDIPLTAHWFLSSRLSLDAMAGLSFARASARGSFTDNTASEAGRGEFASRFKDDDTAFGYLLGGGATIWWENVRLQLLYTYKKHEFDFNAGSFSAPADAAPFTASSSQRITVEDDQHAIWLKAGIKFGGASILE